ncbi:hypothetical protein HOD20_07305 [archaeon]|nr:hypothetical protein [archaeon]
MPIVRYVKAFNKIPPFKHPKDLTNIQGIKKLKADKFPYTASLGLVALIKIEPNFYGTFTLRFPEDTADYHEVGTSNTESEFKLVYLKYDMTKSTFNKAGTYFVSLALDGESIHKTPVIVE